tara:strand:+ start:42 stop:833 length:792 start_codon:yes stop_codon:yes gene_type:complete
MISKIVIFTDLDGTLLHNETFKFENIRQYIKNLLSKNISLIPNSSKTKTEILNFCHELEEELPFIVENGAAIYKMNLVNSDFPEKIILSRDKKEILNVFLRKIPKEFISKCKFVLKLKKDEQLKIFGLSEKQLSYASDREFSVPLLFKGNKVEKNNLFRLVSNMGLTMQEGGRVINLSDKVSKSSAMKKVKRIFEKTEKQKLKIIGVGDNFNDLDMLKNSDIACLVFNEKFKLDTLNINNCLVSKKSAPEGWEEVVKMALEKI